MYLTKIMFVISAFALSTALEAQDAPPAIHQQSSSVPGARYEIVQSELAARWTFRLDRFTGRVAQLVATKDSSTAWEDMLVIGRPQIATPTRARFQIFTSGLAARHTFLIDVDTGRTWLVVSSKEKDKDGVEQEYTVWQPFEGR